MALTKKGAPEHLGHAGRLPGRAEPVQPSRRQHLHYSSCRFSLQQVGAIPPLEALP